MLGALFLYGLQPGPLFFNENPDVVWPIIASMYIGNVLLVMLNLPLVPAFASILRIPYHILYPGILVISVVGVYSINNSMFDIWVLVIFGTSPPRRSCWPSSLAPSSSRRCAARSSSRRVIP
jgi:putative tricarboxylic transport membrane protein